MIYRNAVANAGVMAVVKAEVAQIVAWVKQWAVPPPQPEYDPYTHNRTTLR
jgi:hypothetical protein